MIYFLRKKFKSLVSTVILAVLACTTLVSSSLARPLSSEEPLSEKPLSETTTNQMALPRWESLEGGMVKLVFPYQGPGLDPELNLSPESLVSEVGKVFWVDLVFPGAHWKPNALNECSQQVEGSSSLPVSEGIEVYCTNEAPLRRASWSMKVNRSVVPQLLKNHAGEIQILLVGAHWQERHTPPPVLMVQTEEGMGFVMDSIELDPQDIREMDQRQHQRKNARRP